MTANNNKILVVDDDPNALSATVRLLKTAGYEVFEATTGQACIAASEANHPDLVLLDIILPDINGLDVCRQIKKMPSLAHLFVIMMSASQTSSDQQSLGLESGADGYMYSSELICGASSGLKRGETGQMVEMVRGQSGVVVW